MGDKRGLLLLAALIAFAVFSSGCTEEGEPAEPTPTPEPTETPTPTPIATQTPTATPTPEADLNQATGSGSVQTAAGPGGCTSIEECTAFCSGNQQTCTQFCQANAGNEFCGFQSEKPPLENGLPCNTKEECDVYCAQNPSECGSGEETQSLEVSLPFDPEYYSPRDWGLWPFCVHGGDHPEGHGGIDFELDGDAKILAACDGKVEFIETTESGAEHGEGVMLSCGNFVVSYHGLINIKVGIGDTVEKGDHIADPVRLEDGEYYIHFEINDFISEKLRCPLPYLDSEFKAELEQMHSKSSYPEKGSEPDLCNCDWLPYKESMKAGQ